MKSSGKSYPRYFYERLANSRPTAVHIASAVMNDFTPTSVVDVGCGVGAFLAAFIEAGVTDVCGIDLPPLDAALLQIPPQRYVSHDLTQPVDLNRRFDLALSLEVAEHLPHDSADLFINSLTSLSDVVVFSAAIPRQGGWEHINEQWQDWWARKFEQRGYLAIDSIRDRIWNIDAIPFYYRQNILMFVRSEVLQFNGKLATLYQRTHRNSLACVHPAAYVEKAEPSKVTLRFALQAAPYLAGAGIRAIRSRFHR